MKITAPCTMGDTIELEGDKVGRFLVHRDLMTRITDEGAPIEEGYSVTLIENGIRFPWSFKLKREATRFATEVETLMPWDDVSVEIDPKVAHLGQTTRWRNGPTKEQRQKVIDCAKACGGLRAS